MRKKIGKPDETAQNNSQGNHISNNEKKENARCVKKGEENVEKR